jgi:4-aminobutyrate aminotransferase-like enzyme
VPFGDVRALKDVLAQRKGKVAAVIGEPVQGNGGIRVPPADYWPEVRAVCDEYDVLLILDEVQTGFGRTGRWFACQHWQVAPDIMAVSKALGNGFPIAAFVTTDRIAASYTRPGASTHGGNPMAATAALATLAYHREQRLAERAAMLGEWFLGRLKGLAERHGCLWNPRGMGLMIGADVTDGHGRPDAGRLDALLEELKERGFLCGKTGPERNVLTVMPPLVIEAGQLDALADAIDGSLKATEALA